MKSISKSTSDDNGLRVAVVIPVRNGIKTIQRCLESLLDQNYPGEYVEIIVVDNGSQDGTAALVRRFPVKLEFEHNRISPGAARNKGISVAASDIVAFIDADCTADRDWLRKLVDGFANADAGAVVGSIKSYEPQSLVEEFIDELDPYRFINSENSVNVLTGNLACRMSVLEEIGTFNPLLETAEDLDLGWRIQHIAHKRIVHDPTAVVYHKHRGDIVGLFQQYKRYGFSEILVDTMLRGQSYAPRTKTQQLQQISNQLISLTNYMLALAKRMAAWPLRRHSKRTMLWPVFRFTVESANVIGKLDGLWKTRFFHRHPSQRARNGAT